MIVAQNAPNLAGPGPKVKVPTTKTASTAPSGGGSGSPAPAQPDLTTLLTNDPGYIQAQAAAKAGDATALATRNANINNALINFGAVPDFASIGAQLGLTPDQISAITGAINSNTGALATQYTNARDSVLAKLGDAHTQALNSLRATLAGRGMLESGATGIGTRLEDTNYQQGMASAYQTLLSALLGDQSAYAGALNTDQGNLATAAGDAYQRAIQQAATNPAAYIPGGPPAAAPSQHPGSGVQPFTPSPTNFMTDASSSGPERIAAQATRIANAYTSGRKRFG